MQKEAEISQADLRLLMRLSSVSNPDIMLGRNAQNQAAHTLTVGLWAFWPINCSEYLELIRTRTENQLWKKEKNILDLRKANPDCPR